MKLKACQLILFILLLSAPAYADPVVINFGSGGASINTRYPVYTESGFTFCCNVALDSFNATNNFIETNSFHVTQPTTIRIQWMGGGNFDFLGVDYVWGNGRSVFRGSNGAEIDLDTALQFGFGDAFHNLIWLDWVHYGGNEIDPEDRGPNPLGLDNFRFNTGTTPTPEPATILLLGSGLFGVLKVAKKRRKG